MPRVNRMWMAHPSDESLEILVVAVLDDIGDNPLYRFFPESEQDAVALEAKAQVLSDNYVAPAPDNPLYVTRPKESDNPVFEPLTRAKKKK